MSTSSAIRASSPPQNRLEGPSNLRLPAPAIVVGLLLTCVFLLRLPSALVPRELNVDESQQLSYAMKFLAYSSPWKAIDGGTLTPLNSYLVAIFMWMGFKPGFILVHMLASGLVCLQVLVAYLSLRRLGSEKTAAFGAFLMVLFYGLPTKTDYLHYSTELLPTLLLMVGFYMFLIWLDQPARGSRLLPSYSLFLGGLALGAAPWCKVQALPIAGALGLVMLVAISRRAGNGCSRPSRRIMEVLALAGGGVLTTCTMLAFWAEYWTLKDFWYTNVLANMAYAGSMSTARSVVHSFMIFVISPLNQLLLIGIALLIYVSGSDQTAALSEKQKWALGGVFVYAAAALFSVSRVSYLFPHHAIFLVPPTTYLVAGIALPQGRGTIQLSESSHRLRNGLVLVLLGGAVSVYAAYVVQYVHMVQSIRRLSNAPLDSTSRIAKESATSKASSRTVLEKALEICIGPGRWALSDSNERIVAVTHDIHKAHPVQSLAVWGWAPGLYVLTGIAPATRDSITQHAITNGPLQKYYRTRFLTDLRSNPPDLFIDAVAPDAFMWPEWTGDNGYESDPQLRKFIDDNYIKVDELTLVQGEKPVRFFARRAPSVE